jgi:FAD:protein FMN transferase
MDKGNSTRALQTSRRNFFKVVGSIALSLGLGTVYAKKMDYAQSENKINVARLLMGTIVKITLITPERSSGMAALETAFNEMERLACIFDHRLSSGPLGRLNSDRILLNPPQELVDILTIARKIHYLTSGAFDVTIKPALEALRQGKTLPPDGRVSTSFKNIEMESGCVRLSQNGVSITLDGIAKGKVVDGGVSILKSFGYTNFLVEAGGDLSAQGSRQDGKPWKIGIGPPRKTEQPDTIATVSIGDRAVAASGDYMNAFSADFSQNHIINPETMESPVETASAAAIASSAVMADALSTALMVMGPDAGLALIEQLPDVEAVLVGKDMNIYRSSGFPG